MSADAVDAGKLPGSQPMSVVLHLAPTPERAAALAQFLTDVQTPGSGTYRHWLTPAQFGAKFGATDAQRSAVQSFAAAHGLSVGGVSTSGLRVTLTGSVANFELAMAPAMHQVQVAGSLYMTNTASPVLPPAVSSAVVAVDGLSTVPSEHPVVMGGAALDDVLAGLTGAVESNSTRVLSLGGTACVDDFSADMQSAVELVLQQAAAQGITVLASSSCGARGSAGFPSIFPEVTSVAIAPGVVPAVNPTLTATRPAWQVATGLPSDALRHEPDITVSSLAALTQTVGTIQAEQPSSSQGRLGTMNATLYQLASIQGLYTQPDDAVAGTWEPPTGLGVVDLPMLAKFYPRGSLTDNVSINVSNPGAVHGQSITFSSTVSDTSGQSGGTVPTGTVSFSISNGTVLGPYTLVSGSASSTAYNQLPGSTTNYTVTASYSGDSLFLANSSIATGFAVTGEASVLSATTPAPVAVGGTIVLAVTDKSGSGVGTPSGTITVTPQGTSSTTSYIGTLSGTGGTATTTVSIPATQAGSITLLIACNSPDPSFTCYSPIQVQATGTKASTTTSLTISPNPPITGQGENFTVSVVPATNSSNSMPAITGTVQITDNGSPIGSGSLSSGTATINVTNLSGTTGHVFAAVYGGDNNYSTSTSTTVTTSPQTASTTTAISSSATSVVTGGTVTLTAVVTPTTKVNGVTPSGNVTFTSTLQGQLGTGTISNGTATYTATLTTTGSQVITAIYNGDSSYTPSTSGATTVVVGPATSIAVTATPNPVTYGNNVVLTANVAGTPTSGSTGPSGTVSFNLAGTAQVTASGTLVPTTTTASTATATIPAPTPGLYIVTATCTGTNFTCGNATSANLNLTVSKGNTAVTLTALPTIPVAGQATVFTATISSVPSSTTAVFTGTVTFNINGTAAGTGTVSGNVATFSTTLSSTTGNVVTAVYSGDSNWNTSTSTALTLTIPPVTTTNTLTSNQTTALAGSNIILTASVGYTPASGTTVTTGAPTGTVTFYDVYNGQTVTLGTATLVGTGPYLSVAQISTTGLMQGTHNVSAIYAGVTGTVSYVGSTSSVVVLTMTDYSISFAPATLTLKAGTTGIALATVTALSGFTGQVTLGCTPVAGTATTCNFNPLTITNSGASQLTITTTAPAANKTPEHAGLVSEVTSAAFAVLLCGFLLPSVRRRRPLLMALIASCVLLGGLGCTNLDNVGGSTTGTNGTPLGTEILRITTSGTDGRTVTTHDVQFQVTIQ